ncbi:permease-like cell division protein FtsX [Pontimonas sp.]|uniref:permease-like cell division protein FtsX n=1 Tax=Pontimonas sp. TaxID=2304492 RepID=UPI002870394E|nr:permease-like cell division protein FtsX [Pontimonas sp.]MDR9396747.1 permease-like cell division protein FtsX [Pontimonas sp.]MDR9434290.1 permease-like cell division protein FtsX [Pontimonas sp.]
MRIGFILREVATGLARNASMVVSIVLVTFISLTFVGTAVLLQSQIGEMRNYWFDRAQVAVYLCTDFSTLGGCDQQEATTDQIRAVEAQLESASLSPYIETFYFEDRQMAFDNFREQFAGSAVVDLVSPEFLPETFWVSLVDPQQTDLIFEAMAGLAGVESVVDQRSYLDQIFALLNAGSITAVAVASLMLVAAALLISTTIRLSAFSRRRELGIMRLVGASNRFIQTPFVLEGVVAALAGAVLASGAVWAIVHYFVRGYLVEALPTTVFIGYDEAFAAMPILLATGVILAALASYASISRYLRV